MENDYAEEKILSDKAVGKSWFRELSTDETKKKKKTGKCHTDSDKKATNVSLKLFNGTYLRSFPYKFKEINYRKIPKISSSKYKRPKPVTQKTLR